MPPAASDDVAAANGEHGPERGAARAVGPRELHTEIEAVSDELFAMMVAARERGAQQLTTEEIERCEQAIVALLEHRKELTPEAADEHVLRMGSHKNIMGICTGQPLMDALLQLGPDAGWERFPMAVRWTSLRLRANDLRRDEDGGLFAALLSSTDVRVRAYANDHMESVHLVRGEIDAAKELRALRQREEYVEVLGQERESEKRWGTVQLGQLVPDVSVATIESGELSLRELPRPFVLDFWVTSCHPCWDVRASLREVAARHPDELTVVHVNLDGQPVEDAQRIVGSNVMDVTLASDDPRADQLALGVDQFPTSILVSEAGTIEATGMMLHVPYLWDSVDRMLQVRGRPEPQ